MTAPSRTSAARGADSVAWAVAAWEVVRANPDELAALRKNQPKNLPTGFFKHADDQIVAHATAARRALVTANIKDFIPLDARYRAASQAHAGLILVSAKTFPQDRTFTAAVISALSALLDQPSQIQPGQVLFLPCR